MNDQAISDDQELAKVLSGMQQQANDLNSGDQKNSDAGLNYEEAPAPGAPASTTASPAPTVQSVSAPADPVVATGTTSDPATTAPSSAPVSPGDSSLDELKKSALEELRPLVSKLDLPAKEKFDTLLLIIRSTDDKSLLTNAHEAAKAIEDETERAEALLDIVKEVDYFAGQTATA